MSVVCIEGDLFNPDNDLHAYAHGCNCKGAMGAGIAVEFKRRWPEMYQAYRRECLYEGLDPGYCFHWASGGVDIFNLMTQTAPGRFATCEAIEESVASMLRRAHVNSIDRIGMPRIGCGLGKLRWEKVEAILKRVAGSSPITLEVYLL